jgi:hypothetical protein
MPFVVNIVYYVTKYICTMYMYYLLCRIEETLFRRLLR